MQTDIDKLKSLIDKMPDISEDVRSEVQSELDRVGMSKIEMPIIYRLAGEEFRLPAKLSAFVNLEKKEAKGIHMSRLYLSLRSVLENQALSLKTLKQVLNEFIVGQKGLSSKAYVSVDFVLPVKRKALVSSEVGWRQYPIRIEAMLEGKELTFDMSFQVVYSSTCPCSAALAKQLITTQFEENFEGQKLVNIKEMAQWLEDNALMAVPHAQRSLADVKVKLDKETIAPEPIDLINLIEDALKTPVQAAVKRIDEQEFARRNGENPMFCEDAARKIKAALEEESRVLDYVVKVAHQESLHPHDAVSFVTKGLVKGFKSSDFAQFTN